MPPHLITLAPAAKWLWQFNGRITRLCIEIQCEHRRRLCVTNMNATIIIIIPFSQRRHWRMGCHRVRLAMLSSHPHQPNVPLQNRHEPNINIRNLQFSLRLTTYLNCFYGSTASQPTNQQHRFAVCSFSFEFICGRRDVRAFRILMAMPGSSIVCLTQQPTKWMAVQFVALALAFALLASAHTLQCDLSISVS